MPAPDQKCDVEEGRCIPADPTFIRPVSTDDSCNKAQVAVMQGFWIWFAIGLQFCFYLVSFVLYC